MLVHSANFTGSGAISINAEQNKYLEGHYLHTYSYLVASYTARSFFRLFFSKLIPKFPAVKIGFAILNFIPQVV